MKLSQKWDVKIGNGVIDCAIDTSEKVLVCGDVNGTVTKMSSNGNILFEYQSNMPVWGVDISSTLELIVIGTASKNPLKGELIILKNELEFERLTFEKPVWDVKIIEEYNIILATTWGCGLIVYEVSTKSKTTLDLEGNLFGISISSENKIYITSSGIGIYEGRIVDNHFKFKLLVEDDSSCYNNVTNDKNMLLFSGSSSNMLLNVDLSRKNNTKIYSTLFEQPCGISIIDDNLIIGDLAGNLFISKLTTPNIPIFYKHFGDAIWNITYSKIFNIIYIACGDGHIYSMSLELNSVEIFDFESIPFDKKLLKGTKIFINYAKEDFKYVTNLYHAFKSLDCKPWVDEFNLLPGQNWRSETNKAIHVSDFIIICISSRSIMKRGYVQKEIKQALDIIEYLPDNKIFIIPLRLDDCLVPESLNKWQWVDLFSENGFQKLLYSIFLDRVKNQPYNRI